MHTKEPWLTVVVDTPIGLTFLIFFHIFVCCLSLVNVAYFQFYGYFSAGAFHIFYDPAGLPGAVAAVGVFALVSILFVFVQFSFGYFVGFYLYSMVLGYLWINYFSDLAYDHRLSGLSAAASAIALLAPALLISSPIRQIFILSTRALDRLLTFILLLATAVVIVAAFYNFRIISLGSIYEYRDKLEFPTLIRYLLGITSSALLPFAFACFVELRSPWRASATLVLLLCFYPITLSKLALFTPAWLVIIALLAEILRARTAVVLSLLLPLLAGVLSVTFNTWPPYFYTVNFRMLAIPSNAMDIYNHYFASHDLTYFCQITFLKPLMSCAYEGQLSLVMEDTYHLGNFNASLFATEGIASVGPLLAPISAFLCGLVIAIANRLSANLSCRFILISSAILPQILLNVPLTTSLLSHGAAILFLLWYVMPRSIVQRAATNGVPEA